MLLLGIVAIAVVVAVFAAVSVVGGLLAVVAIAVVVAVFAVVVGLLAVVGHGSYCAANLVRC